MLISLLIAKNMQKFRKFWRLVSKIVFFSSKILIVYFPTGGAATGSLPGRPERLGNIPDHLALEAELTLGPLARCILAIFWFTSTQMCITDFRRSTGKLYEMCLRTPSTLFMPGPGEQLSTYGVV